LSLLGLSEQEITESQLTLITIFRRFFEYKLESISDQKLREDQNAYLAEEQRKLNSRKIGR
jgi:hypothetical protein